MDKKICFADLSTPLQVLVFLGWVTVIPGLMVLIGSIIIMVTA